MNLKSKKDIKINLENKEIKTRNKLLYSCGDIIDNRFVIAVPKDFTVTFNSLTKDFLKFYYSGCQQKSISKYFSQQLISESDILTLPSEEDSDTLRLKLELNILFGIQTGQLVYPNNYYFFKVLLHRPAFIIRREWFM